MKLIPRSFTLAAFGLLASCGGGSGGEDLNDADATAPDVHTENQSPTATFEETTRDLVVSFDASASTDADGLITSFVWNFGDGQVGNGRKVEHGYFSPGGYTVSLTVTDDRGTTQTQSRTVSVAGSSATAFKRDVEFSLGVAHDLAAASRMIPKLSSAIKAALAAQPAFDGSAAPIRTGSDDSGWIVIHSYESADNDGVFDDYRDIASVTLENWAYDAAMPSITASDDFAAFGYSPSGEPFGITMPDVDPSHGLHLSQRFALNGRIVEYISSGRDSRFLYDTANNFIDAAPILNELDSATGELLTQYRLFFEIEIPRQSYSFPKVPETISGQINAFEMHTHDQRYLEILNPLTIALVDGRITLEKGGYLLTIRDARGTYRLSVSVDADPEYLNVKIGTGEAYTFEAEGRLAQDSLNLVLR